MGNGASSGAIMSGSDAVSQHAPSTSGSAVTLAWKPGFNGGLPQSFSIRYNEREVAVPEASLLSSGGHVQFRLTGLEPETEYRVSIAASNDKGRSAPSNEILVKTLGTSSAHARECPLNRTPVPRAIAFLDFVRVRRPVRRVVYLLSYIEENTEFLASRM